MPDATLPALLKEFRTEALRDPHNPLSYYLAALDCRDRGDLDGWRRATEIALSLPHRTPQQLYSRAWAKVTLGDWSGWSEYEIRTLLPEARISDQPHLNDWFRWTHVAWDGEEDLQDQTLLVIPEQGMGDMIQMLRYLPDLIARARSVIAIVYPRLVPLVQCNFGDAMVVAIDGVDKPLRFDRYVRAMSLPGLYRGIPPFAALQAPKRRTPLPLRADKIRGGIVWAGNPEFPDDGIRSLPAPLLASLVARSDIEWHSLQTGPRASDVDAYPSMVRPWPRLITFGDTADLITDLDFVVSVDTAVAHLAASLDKVTYLMLPYRADGRWGLEGTTTPWYPSMRLLRQHTPGNWNSVLAELECVLDGRGSVSNPSEAAFELAFSNAST